MSELSPQAQAVLDAIKATYDVDDLKWPSDEQVAATALRAAADQVVPPALEKEFFNRNHALLLQKKVEIRLKLIDIATELENYQ